jgi:hypothetical protein
LEVYSITSSARASKGGRDRDTERLRSLEIDDELDNIMHTVRYTELTPDRFKNFWED